MSHKPKPIRDHYTESLAINSENFVKQLATKSVSTSEIQIILEAISRRYLEDTEKIVQECESDLFALERVPSPLRLFVDVIAVVNSSNHFSSAASNLMKNYASAWEDWM